MINKFYLLCVIFSGSPDLTLKTCLVQAKLVIAPYSSAMIDNASSFFRNFTKHKIYTYTQRSSFQLQFINKVRGTSLLQPLPINHNTSCLTWPYNHKTKRLKLFYTITDRSQQALRNITKPRICHHNILATVTFHHKAATTIRSSQGLPNITLQLHSSQLPIDLKQICLS